MSTTTKTENGTQKAKRWEQEWLANYRRHRMKEDDQVGRCPDCKGQGEINTCKGNYPSSGEDMRICLCFETCRIFTCPTCRGSGRS